MLNNILLVLLLLLSLAGCSTASNAPAVQLKQGGVVYIRDVQVYSHPKGLKVTGYVRSNTVFSRHISLPGDVYIFLKHRHRGVLQKKKATKHRQYGKSAQWHFDGILETLSFTPDEMENTIILVSFQQDD